MLWHYGASIVLAIATGVLFIDELRTWREARREYTAAIQANKAAQDTWQRAIVALNEAQSMNKTAQEALTTAQAFLTQTKRHLNASMGS